jgi:hypothetical protein
MFSRKQILFSTIGIISVSLTQATFEPGLMIPVYWYPEADSTTDPYTCTDADIITIATSSVASRTIAILNPDNGPDTTSDVDLYSYTACIDYLRAAGVMVVGYVHTKDGYPNIDAYRDISLVYADIDTWYTTYTIDGIFVDEVSNLWPDSSYDSAALTLANV